MEPKKNPQVDLNRKYNLFFSIGLLISIMIVVMAFEYRQVVNPNDKTPARRYDLPDDIEYIPVTVLPPPPEMPQPTIVEVDDDELIPEIDINLDAESSEITAIGDVIIPPVDIREEDINMLTAFPEEEASPSGGWDAFYAFLRSNLKYPTPARRIGIEGKVFVQFVVERDGSLSNINVLKGIGGGCDDEAVRVLKALPKWNPGKQRGNPVRQQMQLAIAFQLK